MSIYVISNELNIEHNFFKIGRTKDTPTEIVIKYQRYLSCARLLLWYPSTLSNYKNDEREILRLFDANRNRTPNGSKNEWVTVPFEQLKSKMDEYFEQDGEEFEEEQKREYERKLKEREEQKLERGEVDSSRREKKCEYCMQIFLAKNLQRHYSACKKKDIVLFEEQFQEQFQEQLQEQRELHEKQLQEKLQEQRELHEKQLQEKLQEQRELHEKQLQNQREMFEKEIQSLKEQKEQLVEFKNQLFEIAKQHKTTETFE
jgi:hypothetical protein